MSTRRPAPLGLTVRGLARRFGTVTAVAGLDFDVAPGELFGLVGPDGAGKTTTLRMLAGVLRPSAGDATVGGLSVAAAPERIKAGLAYMPQRFGLYTDLTVAENLDFYADLFRVPRAERAARRERLYAFSGLAPFRDRLAGQLSGGMKQKLGLSCALIHEPRLLLLDEPTFGVDPVSRRDLWRIVHEMVAHGVTAVVSTSYLDEAERFDRLALLYQGRLLAVATPRELVAAHTAPLVEVAHPAARTLAPALAGVPGVVAAHLFGDRLHVTLTHPEEERSLAAALAAAGAPDVVTTRIAPSLEDVFLARIAAAEAAAA